MFVHLLLQPYSASRNVLPGAWKAELARLAADGGEAATSATAAPASAAPAAPTATAAAAAAAAAGAPSERESDAAAAAASASSVPPDLLEKVSAKRAGRYEQYFCDSAACASDLHVHASQALLSRGPVYREEGVKLTLRRR